jgi:hypothetical protein
MNGPHYGMLTFNTYSFQQCVQSGTKNDNKLQYYIAGVRIVQKL